MSNGDGNDDFKPFLSVMATANDINEGSWTWSHREMTAGGKKLTGIGIEEESFLGFSIDRIRAR